MRAVETVGLICCALMLGFANSATAVDGDIYSGTSSFSSHKKTKAKDSPAIGVALPIPPDIVEGVEFELDCLLEARKNGKGAPQSGVKGTLALFAIALDVPSGTWAFHGLLSGGIEFKTKKDGTAVMSSGPVTAGPWATDAHITNDFISAKILFANSRRIKETDLYCQIIVGE
jgi:hypothetical protein